MNSALNSRHPTIKRILKEVKELQEEKSTNWQLTAAPLDVRGSVFEFALACARRLCLTSHTRRTISMNGISQFVDQVGVHSCVCFCFSLVADVI
jgi:hypothetical protein